jgi:hypothetical protein
VAVATPYVLMRILTPWAGPPVALTFFVLWCRYFPAATIVRHGKRRSLSAAASLLLLNTMIAVGLAVGLLWPA